MTTPKNKDSTNTVDEIKKTALLYISKYGYEGTTLKDIAQKVGIKTPSIYSHFDSKEQLYNEILKDLRTNEREKLMKLVISLRKKTIEEVFKELFYYYTDSKNILFWQISLKELLLHPPNEIQKKIREDFQEFENEISIQLSEFFQIGKAEGWIKREDKDEMISLFFTLIDGLLIEQNLYDDKQYEIRRDEIWKLYREILTQ